MNVAATQAIPLDCESLYALAVRLSPVLRFHPQERFFPVLAESWLTHTTEAPWVTDSAHWLGDLAPDANRRGMALCQLANGQLQVIAGQPVGGNRPLQLSVSDSDPYAIGASALHTVDGTTFLDLAGWDPSSGFAAGDTERLYALYSELAAAMNDQQDWTPLHGLVDLPHAWIPPSVNPTTYCEANWAGDFQRISDAAGQGDFPPGDNSLDSFLALTYHYLYPALETAPDDVVRRLEGQWESATIFLRGEGLGKLPDPTVTLPPYFIVVSQNLEQANSYHHVTALAGWNPEGDWPTVELLGEHPVLYVSQGTHKFFFSAVSAGDPDMPPDPGLDPGPHSDDPDTGGLTDLLELGLILLFIAGVILILTALVVLPVILIILAITLLLLWLASLIQSDLNDGTGTPIPGSTPNDEANGDGTQGGGTEDPAGASPPPTGSGPSVGLPNTGSPTGEATVSFDVRLIDRIFPTRAPPTGYPSESLCENPTWWDYSGGWGIRVQGGFGTGWENGNRRIDEFGRSLAYWNGLRLSTVLHGGATRG